MAPDQARVVLDIWSTRLTRYVAATGIVVEIHDWLLTIEDEVCLTFSRLRPGSLGLLSFGRGAWFGQEI